MKKTLLFLALSCVSFAASATEANGISYSYADLDYIYGDASDASYQGLGLKGSFEIGAGFFITGSYREQKIDNFGGSNDVSEWTLGGGFAKSLSDNLDWVTQAAYVEKDAELSLGQFPASNGQSRLRDDVAGFRVSSGVRGRISPKLIGHAYLGYEDLGDVRDSLGSLDFDGDVYGDLGLEYQFTKRWSATTSVMLSKGVTEYTGGLRLSF